MNQVLTPTGWNERPHCVQDTLRGPRWHGLVMRHYPPPRHSYTQSLLGGSVPVLTYYIIVIFQVIKCTFFTTKG